jgi:autotransporter-associated beta strand protein
LGKGSTISIGSTNESAFTVLKYTGTGETTDKIINLSGTNVTGQTVSGGATLDQSGSGNLKFTSAMTSTGGTGAKKIYLTGSSTGTGEFAGAISDFGANTNSLVKTGTGKWSLSGANTYTGATEVREGTLQISSGGSITSATTISNTATLLVNGTAGAVTVNSGGSLGGSGTNNGAVTLISGSLLKPGNSPGNLTAASSVWNSGATYEWQITSLTGTAGTDWDLFTVTGGLDLSALSSSATFNLSLDSAGALAGFSDTSEYTWTFAKAASITGLSSTDAGTDISSLFNILAANFNGGAGPANGFKVLVGETSGGYTSLNLKAVPEPSASSLMGIGLAALMIVRTFRRRQS